MLPRKIFSKMQWGYFWGHFWAISTAIVFCSVSWKYYHLMPGCKNWFSHNSQHNNDWNYPKSHLVKTETSWLLRLLQHYLTPVVLLIVCAVDLLNINLLITFLTLGVHAQRGLLYLVCVSVCLLLNISLYTWLFVPQTILPFSAADEGRKF